MFSTKEAKKKIISSDNILIFPNPDKKTAIPVAMGLFYSLKEMKKDVNIALEEIPEKFHFLAPDLSYISSPKKYSLSIDSPTAKISEVKYEKKNTSLNFKIKTEKGILKKNQIRFNVFQNQPNLLVTIGFSRLSKIDKSLIPNVKSLSGLSILNINNNEKSKKFGETNLISSKYLIPEIATDLIKSINHQLITQKSASCLLAGIIVSSNHFQDSKTSPRTLEVSGFLKKKGASHQKIVSSLFKSKSLNQIKILGRILQNINFHPQSQTYWATFGSGLFPSFQNPELRSAIQDLELNLANSPNLLLLEGSNSEKTGKINGIFSSKKEQLIKKIFDVYPGEKNKKQLYFSTKEPSVKKVKNKIFNVLTS